MNIVLLVLLGVLVVNATATLQIGWPNGEILSRRTSNNHGINYSTNQLSG